MKQLLVNAFTAAVVSVSVVLFLSPDSEEYRLNQLANRLDENSKAISDALVEISRSRESGSHRDHSTSISSKYIETSQLEEVREKVEALEGEVNSIKLATSPGPQYAKTKGIVELYSRSQRTQVEAGFNTHDKLAEEEFQIDAGVALGEYADSIVDTLHAIPNIQVSELDCKNSVCKITYSEDQSNDFGFKDNDEPAIVDLLAQRIDGYAVEVRYASDPHGRRIMYVQLK